MDGILHAAVQPLIVQSGTAACCTCFFLLMCGSRFCTLCYISKQCPLRCCQYSSASVVHCDCQACLVSLVSEDWMMLRWSRTTMLMVNCNRSCSMKGLCMWRNSTDCGRLAVRPDCPYASLHNCCCFAAAWHHDAMKHLMYMVYRHMQNGHVHAAAIVAYHCKTWCLLSVDDFGTLKI